MTDPLVVFTVLLSPRSGVGSSNSMVSLLEPLTASRLNVAVLATSPSSTVL